jgi:hypothetical protein
VGRLRTPGLGLGAWQKRYQPPGGRGAPTRLVGPVPVGHPDGMLPQMPVLEPALREQAGAQLRNEARRQGRNPGHKTS